MRRRTRVPLPVLPEPALALRRAATRVARALAQDAEILLLDEFTANLDINYQVELARLIKRITRERNLATLIVSHELNLLTAFSDRIVLMANGVIRHQGAVQEVVTQDNLKQIFGLDFSVRLLSNGIPEILPIISEGNVS